ncbi:hypothetical protein [Neptunomonas concharum]|uniref:Uncharacterized protein n=1 Tax=Neptunomonas concharum TaxID=1031538 RepID=A0A5P1R9S0_9GAMM|nr:hypothetical protein [Neptunomonas concharum]QEQ96380.1 hypothetical protein F0U83_06485 [Neptunomonas concharum]
MKLLLQMLWLWFLPQWMADQSPDSRHFYRRQFTRDYQKKRAVVQRLWICSAFVMLCFPSLVFIAVISLFSTFLSFCILDES